MKNSVETKALAIGYGKAALARDIALGAAKGQVLALIGPNGAGKSTLLKTLAGQLTPLGGAVLLDGQELARIPGNARAQKLALMLPHTRRTELTTCFEFAAAGRIPYTGRLGILSAEDKKQVQNALELVGAAHLADRDFNCVSDGQRQRILLARAVCQQPQVLLLDEPTSFLDIKGKIELLTILQNWRMRNSLRSLSPCTSWTWRRRSRTRWSAFRRTASLPPCPRGRPLPGKISKHSTA